jgi:P27 family predicted phage terminase small subunit
VVVRAETQPVAADPNWREPTVESWVAFWSSPLAQQVQPSDYGALLRLWWCYDEVLRARDAIETTGRVVAGSQGQPRPNPLYKLVSELQAEARQLEDRFGLSPMARLKLGIVFADAQQSLESLNDRLSQRMSEVDDLWGDFDG